MQNRNRTPLIALIVLLFALSAALRWASLPANNVDMIGYLKWYDQISARGLDALSGEFSVYAPPYLYLVWLATLTRGFLDPIVALKLIPIAFDLLSAFAVYKIVRLKYPEGTIPLLASAILLLLPTVLVNSSFWGETDALYTSLLLLCVYFLLSEHPFHAMLAFGLAFSFKAQPAFLIPFLIVLAFKRRIPWRYFLIPPLTYVLMILPAVAAGRPFLDALTIYVSQAGTFDVPSMHAPNLYSLIIYPPYFVDWGLALRGGFAAAAIAISVWVFVYARKKYELSQRTMILSALACLTLVPFVLPKMHDRYFYPADVLSLAFAFYYPSYWFVPLLFQAASGIVYYIFLVPVDPARFNPLFAAAATFTSLALVVLLVRQHRETGPPC